MDFRMAKKIGCIWDITLISCLLCLLDWNKLLIAARKSRGPYLCPSTRTFHVDRASKLYWTGYTEADAAE